MSSSKPQKYLIPKYVSLKHRIFKLPHFPKVLRSHMSLGWVEILVFSLEAGHAISTPLPSQPEIGLAYKTSIALVGNQEILNFHLSFAIFLSLNCPNY